MQRLFQASADSTRKDSQQSDWYNTCIYPLQHHCLWVEGSPQGPHPALWKKIEWGNFLCNLWPLPKCHVKKVGRFEKASRYVAHCPKVQSQWIFGRGGAMLLKLENEIFTLKSEPSQPILGLCEILGLQTEQHPKRHWNFKSPCFHRTQAFSPPPSSISHYASISDFRSTNFLTSTI